MQPASEYELCPKQISPSIGPSQSEKRTYTYDMVKSLDYLYIRVLKAKDLPGGCDPFAEVCLGNWKGITSHFEKKTNPEWNQVFAFSKKSLQSSGIIVRVKDKPKEKSDDFIGHVRFVINEIPRRVPPDSPLAPQWYTLIDKKGNTMSGQIMLAIWKGTQADEAFSEATHEDTAQVPREGLANTRSNVYVSPKLWYLKVQVIQAQDLQIKDKSSNIFIKAVCAGVLLKTRNCNERLEWNEEMIFVVAEPFEDHLFLTTESRAAPNKEEVLGQCIIALNVVEKRIDPRPIVSHWYSLKRPAAAEGEPKEGVISGKLNLKVFLEGGYHVMDESINHSSDFRPTAMQLWTPSIGILEVGILDAQLLHPMKTKDGRGTADAFCVAKYGQKWVRTRTAIDSMTPVWQEQYTWEVFDSFTVLTIGVFDNGHLKPSKDSKDSKMGKIRIRVSTLETGRVYIHSYPLWLLLPSELKKMGELQLAVRFTCSSLLNVMHMCTKPLLPKMHYICPLPIGKLDYLRDHATLTITARLSRAEPPLRKEVVGYMLEVGSQSMRQSKTSFFRLVNVLGSFQAAWNWFDRICHWVNPLTTILMHILLLVLIFYPELILPTVFLYLFLIGIWYYRWRPRSPAHIDGLLTQAVQVHADDLDEELDTFPTSKPPDIVKMRYDRLRTVVGMVRAVVGDVATQFERLQALLSWRDPRATGLFVTFCLVAAIILYVTPFQMVAIITVLYVLRHPKFRHRLPSVPLNFFKRLPSRTDCLL